MNLKDKLYIQQYKEFIEKYKKHNSLSYVYDPVTQEVRHDLHIMFDRIYTIICSHNYLVLKYFYKLNKSDIELVNLSLYLLFYESDRRFMKQVIARDKYISKKNKNLIKDCNYQLDILLNKLLKI